MEQVTKEELLKLYHASKNVNISRIKVWFDDGKLEVLNGIDGTTLSEKVFRFLFPEKSKGCEICEKNTKFLSINRGFTETCSIRCGLKLRWKSVTPEQELKRQNRRNKTNLEKYGVVSPMHVPHIANKISLAAQNRTSEEKDETNNKRKVTNLEKYGVEFIQQLEETKEKIENTNMLRYGAKNPSQSEVCKEKRKQTHLTKFGVENVFQLDSVKKQIKITTLKNFGVENPSQSPEIAERKLKTSYLKKEYILPSGKKILIQGYEGFVIDKLLETYNEEDLILLQTEMPIIWYYLDGKKHRYIPDIYIVSENKIIEVKSDHTMKLHLRKNWAKKSRCEEMGLGFEFIIYNGNMQLIDEKEFLI